MESTTKIGLDGMLAVHALHRFSCYDDRGEGSLVRAEVRFIVHLFGGSFVTRVILF